MDQLKKKTNTLVSEESFSKFLLREHFWFTLIPYSNNIILIGSKDQKAAEPSCRC